ncbi:hypothetical protein Tco_0555460 [Tanacetum coccineum]
MYGFKECSSCEALYNKEHCCSNVSSVDNFVRDPNPNSYPSYSPLQPQTSSFNQRRCFHCEDTLEEDEYCKRCTCKKCGSGLSKGFCFICASSNENSSIDDSNPNSFIDSPKVFNPPPQPLTHSIESMNDNPNFDDTPQEQSVHYQDPSENFAQIFSQSPPQINQNCCYGCGDSLDGIFCQRCTCESCGNGAHYGYNCPPQVPIISNPEPCNNQTVDELPQTLPSFDPTCYSGDGSSFTYDATPNFVDDSLNIFNPPSQPPTYSCEFCGNDAHYGYDCPPQVPFIYNPELFDQFEPPQHPVIHQSIQEKTCVELLAEEQAANIDQSPPQEMSIQDMKDLKQHSLDEIKSLINDLQMKDYRNERIDIQYRRECEIRIYELKQNFNRISIEIRKKEKELLQQEHAAYVSTSQWFNFIYDDDDDEESSIPLSDVIYELPPCIAITPVLSTMEPVDSLIMKDEHLDTTQATESDELIKSSVENLVPIPSESEDFSDIESEYDVPDCDHSQTTNFSTFSNPLFDNSTSSDDESSHEEIIHEIRFKTFSNPLFDLDEEIISSEFNLIHNEDLDSTPKNDRFDIESYLLESLLNRDTLMASSPKIDSLFNEFAGELITIPPRIVNREHKEYISLLERLLYDNLSPRPPEDFHAIPNTIIESFSPSPIPVEDSNSLMEEIGLFLISDNSMPLAIKNDDYDSEGDILFLEEFLSNDSPSLPENESFHFDIPSSPRPPAKPPDDGIYFEPDTGLLTTKVVGAISENYVLMPRLLPTQPTLCPVIDTLLPFSSENEDKVHLLSHRGFKAFQIFSESPMMIYGGDIPLLDVPFLHFYPL